MVRSMIDKASSPDRFARRSQFERHVLLADCELVREPLVVREWVQTRIELCWELVNEATSLIIDRIVPICVNVRALVPGPNLIRNGSEKGVVVGD